VDIPVISALLMSGLGLALAAWQASNPATLPTSPETRTEVAAEVKVKAGLVFNFAKFGTWPAMGVDSPIVLCVVGAEAIATVLADTARGVSITGHALEVRRPETTGSWRACHVLFVGESASAPGAEGIRAIRKQPILTVSDGKGFSRSGGVIEFYIQDGRMRFIINLDALDRAGVRLSSRLLGLAKTIRDGDD
jgi:hypothetical protein